MKTQSLPKEARDHRANQLNPQHPAYHTARGASPSEAAELAARERAKPEQSSPPKSPPAGSSGQKAGNQ